MNQRLFQAYVMADWSAASKPTTGPDSVWIGVLKRNVRFQMAFESHNPATRVDAEKLLNTVLDDLKRKGFREIARVLKPAGRLLAFDMTGKGSRLWRIVALVGHRFPDNYGRSLADLMQEAGLSPEILPAQKKQYVTILARKR